MKRVLVLGAGLVSGPLVRYLLQADGFSLTVADQARDKAEALVLGAENGTALGLDVRDETTLERLISEHDLTISLLPYVFHPLVATLALRHAKHMVTASYVKPEMQALDAAARDAGVLLLNEVGVDPGIDHMSAMKVIHSIQERGGRIVSFTSNTGGLPAPDANDNPMGYKFSWAPRGVVLAGKNPARFLKDGVSIDVPGPELFAHHWPCAIKGFGTLEVYPNRDSLPYIESYGIPHVQDMFRGTLRYPGWCDTLKAIVDLGWLDETERTDLKGLSFADLVRRLLTTEADPKTAVAERLGLPLDAKPITDLEWLGWFSDEPLPKGADTLLDVVALRMLEKMQYADDERDMLVMQHEFVAEYPDRRERITSTLVDYGTRGGETSMSRLVGLPAAIAAKHVLLGTFDQVGVQVPMIPEIYHPILDELEDLGVSFHETVEVV